MGPPVGRLMPASSCQFNHSKSSSPASDGKGTHNRTTIFNSIYRTHHSIIPNQTQTQSNPTGSLPQITNFPQPNLPIDVFATTEYGDDESTAVFFISRRKATGVDQRVRCGTLWPLHNRGKRCDVQDNARRNECSIWPTCMYPPCTKCMNVG